MADLDLCLCGDVMTGRGLNQIWPHSREQGCDEDDLTAERYVDLAEARNGLILRPAAFEYIWGDALGVLQQCDMRVVNLETSITHSRHAWPKRVRYKMSPANVACLSIANIDCCSLANNHVLDFGYSGLLETLETLKQNKVPFAGAGNDDAQAATPVVKDIPVKGRVIVFCFGSTTSGIPEEWAAGPQKPGVNLLTDLSPNAVQRIVPQLRAAKRSGDVLIVSIHWGANFGYEIPSEQRLFAHRLIDLGGVDIIHGHSSHHVKGIEIYDGKLILYGCGDFLNDYEGIPGYEEFRDDLVLMYRPRVCAANGRTTDLLMMPFQIRQFRLNRATARDALWLCETLNRESFELGAKFKLSNNEMIELVL